MAKPLIPLRPENDAFTSLTPGEKDCLSYLVLTNCKRDKAFFAFARPDLLISASKASVVDTMKQFFSSKPAKDYSEAYKKTLDNFLNPPKPESAPAPVGTMEERKARAKTKATEFAMSLAEDIDNAADPEYVLKLMDKVGLLDGDEEVEEQPRRYLPVTCSECAYRKFVEENCEEVPDGTEIAEESKNE